MGDTGKSSAAVQRGSGIGVDGIESDNNHKNWRCAKCGEGLVLGSTVFSYLGMTFSHEVLRCAKCRKVFIPRELANGKMAEVEMMMEDKEIGKEASYEQKIAGDKDEEAPVQERGRTHGRPRLRECYYRGHQPQGGRLRGRILSLLQIQVGYHA
jgi:phage FluMu protein Com